MRRCIVWPPATSFEEEEREIMGRVLNSVCEKRRVSTDDLGKGEDWWVAMGEDWKWFVVFEELPPEGMLAPAAEVTTVKTCQPDVCPIPNDVCTISLPGVVAVAEGFRTVPEEVWERVRQQGRKDKEREKKEFMERRMGKGRGAKKTKKQGGPGWRGADVKKFFAKSWEKLEVKKRKEEEEEKKKQRIEKREEERHAKKHEDLNDDAGEEEYEEFVRARKEEFGQMRRMEKERKEAKEWLVEQEFLIKSEEADERGGLVQKTGAMECTEEVQICATCLNLDLSKHMKRSGDGKWFCRSCWKVDLHEVEQEEWEEEMEAREEESLLADEEMRELAGSMREMYKKGEDENDERLRREEEGEKYLDYCYSRLLIKENQATEKGKEVVNREKQKGKAMCKCGTLEGCGCWDCLEGKSRDGIRERGDLREEEEKEAEDAAWKTIKAGLERGRRGGKSVIRASNRRANKNIQERSEQFLSEVREEQLLGTLKEKEEDKRREELERERRWGDEQDWLIEWESSFVKATVKRVENGTFGKAKPEVEGEKTTPTRRNGDFIMKNMQWGNGVPVVTTERMKKLFEDCLTIRMLVSLASTSKSWRTQLEVSYTAEREAALRQRMDDGIADFHEPHLSENQDEAQEGDQNWMETEFEIDLENHRRLIRRLGFGACHNCCLCQIIAAEEGEWGDSD